MSAARNTHASPRSTRTRSNYPSRRLVGIIATLGVLIAACASASGETDSDTEVSDPTGSRTSEARPTPTPPRAADEVGDSVPIDTTEPADPASELLTVADQVIGEANLPGPFYEFTLLQYGDPSTTDEYDHETFLPESAQLVYSAEVERQLQGDTAWDRMEVVFYPDESTYLATLGSSTYAAAERERAEIVERWHVALAEPITPVTGEPLIAGQEPEIAPVPAPSDNPDDPPFMLVAAVEIVDQAALERHYAGAASAGGGGDIGARPVMWMDVTTTLVGDADIIDSVRFNYWSSHSAFDAVMANDPDTSNREDGLGAASTMMTLPTVDQFTPEPREPADVQRTDEEIAALYTPAAMDFLDATIGFSRCLVAEGQPWMGEPDPDDPDVDPEYLIALGACAGELGIEVALVRLFGESPDAVPVSDIPVQYTSDTSVTGLVAIDTFISCIGDAGYEWLGAPGEAADPDAPANSSDYLFALGNCTSVSGIQAALDGMLS